MTAEPIFFYVFRHPHDAARLDFALYYDAPPTKAMLVGRKVVFRQELKGMYRASSIEALARDYRERAANGTLPKDNMIPTRIIKPRRGISHAIPKPPWRTGASRRRGHSDRTLPRLRPSPHRLRSLNPQTRSWPRPSIASLSSCRIRHSKLPYALAHQPSSASPESETRRGGCWLHYWINSIGVAVLARFRPMTAALIPAHPWRG